MGTTTDHIEVGAELADGSTIVAIEDVGHDRAMRYVDSAGRSHYWDYATRLVAGYPVEPRFAGWASD